MNKTPVQMNPFKAILITIGALLAFILMGTLLPVMMGTPWTEAAVQLIQMMGCCLLGTLGCVLAIAITVKLMG